MISNYRESEMRSEVWGDRDGERLTIKANRDLS